MAGVPFEVLAKQLGHKDKVAQCLVRNMRENSHFHPDIITMVLIPQGWKLGHERY